MNAAIMLLLWRGAEYSADLIQYSVDSSSVFTARSQGTICKAPESPTVCVAKFMSTGG